MPIKHAKTSAVVDAADTGLVRPSEWNADHTGENYATVQEEGVDLTQRAKLNFIGDVTAADDAANARTNVTVSVPTPYAQDPTMIFEAFSAGQAEGGVSGTGTAAALVGLLMQLDTGTTSGSHAGVAAWVVRGGLAMANVRFFRYVFAGVITPAAQCDIICFLKDVRNSAFPANTVSHYGARVSSAGTAGNWLASVANGTTETTVDSTIAVEATDYLIVGTFDGTSYRMYLNGVLRGTITTNLPTVSGGMYMQAAIKSSDATNHRVDVLSGQVVIVR